MSKFTSRAINVFFIALLLLLPSFAVSAQQRYKVIDLGVLSGRGSCARDINDNGQVVGWTRVIVDPPPPNDPPIFGDDPIAALSTSSTTDLVRTHAFLWDASSGMRDLGALTDVRAEHITICRAHQDSDYDKAQGERIISC